jgi:hypothetical protein
VNPDPVTVRTADPFPGLIRGMLDETPDGGKEAQAGRRGHATERDLQAQSLSALDPAGTLKDALGQAPASLGEEPGDGHIRASRRLGDREPQLQHRGLRDAVLLAHQPVGLGQNRDGLPGRPISRNRE